MSQADIVDHRTLTINHVADLTHVTSLWWSALWTMDGKVFEVLPPRHAKQTSCHRRTTHRLTDRLTTTCESSSSISVALRCRCCRLAVAGCTTLPNCVLRVSFCQRLVLVAFQLLVMHVDSGDTDWALDVAHAQCKFTQIDANIWTARRTCFYAKAQRKMDQKLNCFNSLFLLSA